MAPDTTRPDNTPSTPLDTAPKPRLFGSPPMLSQAEAARQCGVSTATIRRARERGDLPGAVETADGWRIPVPELVAAGLMDRKTPPDTGTTPQLSRATTPPSDTPDTPSDTATQLAELRLKLIESEHRAELAEAREKAARELIAEKERALDDARAWRRMIEAGSLAEPNPGRHQEPTHPTPAAPTATSEPTPQTTPEEPAAPPQQQSTPAPTYYAPAAASAPRQAAGGGRLARWFGNRSNR